MTLLPRRSHRLLLAVLITFAALAVSARAASADVLWKADGEHAQSQEWASESCADTSRVKQVSSPAAQGAHAYELTLHDGDQSWGERCELGMGNPGGPPFPLFHEGDDRWISFQVYLPSDFPINTPNWNVIFQIHQQGDGGCPPLALHVEDGQFKLFNSSSPYYVLDTVEKWHAPAQANTWAKFTLHIKFSGSDSVGFVELYGDLDGTGMKQLMARQYMHTMTLYSDGSPMTEHARIGMYRDPAITGDASILFDGFTIATDQASAESNAFAGPSPGGDTTPPPTSTRINPTTAPPKPPTVRTKRHARVWLRSNRSRVHAARSVWPNVVRVYGGVRPLRGGAPVIIELFRHGHWEWLNRGWLHANGRFYIAANIDTATTGRSVKLRAVVPGVGHSKTIHARV
jgi:hypothetical protein